MPDWAPLGMVHIENPKSACRESRVLSPPVVRRYGPFAKTNNLKIIDLRDAKDLLLTDLQPKFGVRRRDKLKIGPIWRAV